MTERGASRLVGNASGIVILTISGIMAGLGFGMIRAWAAPNDPILTIGRVVAGAIVGTVLGLGLAILLALRERGSFRSLKKTMAFIAVAAVVVWATITLLRQLILEP